MRARRRSRANYNLRPTDAYAAQATKGGGDAIDEADPSPFDAEAQGHVEKSKKKKEFTSETCMRYSIIAGKTVLRVMIIVFFFWVLTSLLKVSQHANKALDKRHAVIPADVRLPNYEYYVTDLHAEEVTLNLMLEGPFISLQEQKNYAQEDLAKAEVKQYVFQCVLERWTVKNVNDSTDRRTIKRPGADSVQADDKGRENIVMFNDTGTTHMFPLDYQVYPRSARLVSGSKGGGGGDAPPSGPPGNGTNSPDTQDSQQGGDQAQDDSAVRVFYALGFGVDTSQKKAVPFSLSYRVDPITMKTRVLTGIIPLLVFATLVSVQINRGVAAYVTIAAASSGYVKLGLPVKVVDLLTWMDPDFFFYIFSMNLLMSLLVETKVYSFLAFKFVSRTKLNFWASALFINFLAGFLSLWFNNIYVAALLLPLTVRLAELVGVHPIPLILNMVFMCNIGGRGFVGTFGAIAIMEMDEGKDAGINLKKMLDVCMAPTITVLFMTLISFMLLYKTFGPQRLGPIKEVQENRHLMTLWFRYSQSIPNVSLRYHIIKRKITEIRRHLYQEVHYLKIGRRPYDFPQKSLTVKERLSQMAPDNKMQNGYLLVKCIIILGVTVGFMIPYIYNIKMESIWRYEQIRLGYIGIFVILLTLFFVHSRDFELLLKRIDWSSLLVFIAINVSASVFVIITEHMGDFLWKSFGTRLEGSSKQKVHNILGQILAYTSVTGYFNEHVMMSGFIEAVLRFAIYKGLNALHEILGAFLVLTGCWGHVTLLGTGPNIVIAGMAEQQGYRITFYKWMTYGLCFALIGVVVLYMYMGQKYCW